MRKSGLLESSPESGYTPVIPHVTRKTILSRCRSDVSYRR